MRYDTIIVGGGLAGLVCGLRLQQSGKKTAIVSAGQNAMHFSSGAFGLLSRLEDGTPVDEPLTAIDRLSGEHPYSKIGSERMSVLVREVKPFFEAAGIPLTGDESRNSYIITPTGNYKKVWLALDDMTLLGGSDSKIGDKILIVNFKGYLDFNTAFIAEGLEKRGMKCRIESVELPEMERLRSNSTEMRSVNIARVLDGGDAWKHFVASVNRMITDEDTVILPAVFGFADGSLIRSIREGVRVKTVFIGTMPPSVPGIRSQMRLKKAYELSGGTILLGDQANSPVFDGDRLVSLGTVNMEEVRLEADNFVIATGSFFSRGLWATPEKVLEPLLGLDVISSESRDGWYDEDFFSPQGYIGFGVRTDNGFHPMRGGRPMENVFAIGSLLGGCNSVKMGCGAGVAIMTALEVANTISSSR